MLSIIILERFKGIFPQLLLPKRFSNVPKQHVYYIYYIVDELDTNGLYCLKNNLRRTFKQEKLPFLEASFILCAHLGSNQGPKDYESSTLTD